MCLPSQHWTKALVWFNDVDVSGFHNCAFVVPWQSLSDWRLLLSAFVLCVATRISELELEQRTNNKFLVKLGKRGNEIREKLVQVHGDNALKKTAVYMWVKGFYGGREIFTDEEYQDDQQQEELKKILQKFVKLCVKIVGWLSGAYQNKRTSTGKQLGKS